MPVCTAGCPRTPHYVPRPFDADVAPSSLVPHDTVRAERREIGDSPCRKLAFSMARRGGRVAQEGRAHAGMCLPMCPWPLGTLQAQPLVCEVRNGRASHSTPAEGAGFWPDFRQNRGSPPKVFLMGEDGTGRIHRCWCVLLDAPGPHFTCHGRLMRMWCPPASCHIIPCGLSGPRLATRRAGSWPSPWHVEVAVSARRAVRMPGCVCLCAHGHWGHRKPNHWFVRCVLVVHHTLHRARVPDFGQISAKIAEALRMCLMGGDGTGRIHRCWCVLVDAPGSHVTCHSRLMRMWRLVPHDTVRSERPEIGDSLCRKSAFSVAR